MKLIEMTIEEALTFAKGNKNEKVLVAVYDLEDQKGIAAFSQKDQQECENIIKEAETVAALCDNFINGLRCFTAKQDIQKIRCVGKMSTILIHNDRTEHEF